jgi:hypothetical protein
MYGLFSGTDLVFSCHSVVLSVSSSLLLQLAAIQAVFDVLLDRSVFVPHLPSYYLSVPLSSPPNLFDPLL